MDRCISPLLDDDDDDWCRDDEDDAEGNNGRGFINGGKLNICPGIIIDGDNADCANGIGGGINTRSCNGSCDNGVDAADAIDGDIADAAYGMIGTGMASR